MTKIRFIDACIPDYFLGCGGEVFAVPVDENTTYAELYESIVHDYNNSIGEEIPDFHDSLNSLFADCAMNEKAFPDLEPCDDENAPTVYAYFEAWED